MTALAPPEFYTCPDCTFTAPMFLQVAQHMTDAHRADHPDEVVWYDSRTFEPCWEDEDVMDQ